MYRNTLVVLMVLLSSYFFGCGDENFSSINSSPTSDKNSGLELDKGNIIPNTQDILGPSFMRYEGEAGRLQSQVEATRLNEQNRGSDTSFSYIQIIACYEPEYLKAVLQRADSELPDSVIYYFGSNYGIVQICDWVYAHFGTKPLCEWPIVIIPTAQYQAIDAFVKMFYPKINIIMPYMPISWTNITYPTTLTINQAPSLVMTVSGGNDRRDSIKNDWTMGNGLDFIDSTDIQYVDNENIYTFFPIDSVYNLEKELKVYSSVVWFVRSGWCIWMDVKKIARNQYARYNITGSNTQLQYILTNNLFGYIIPPSSRGGMAKINFQSGAIGALGAKVNKSMRILTNQGFDATFQNIRKLGYQTSVNPRNNEVGSGNFDVDKVIRAGQTSLPQVSN